jgi:recombination protein RecT
MSQSGTAVNGSLAVRNAGLATFGDFLKKRTMSIGQVAPSFIRPERMMKIVLSSVSRTPALMDCSMQSIFIAMLQAAELGLEPGSATGEAYLVPFKGTCQMIPGYQGLTTLAFRSGFVSSVMAREVYEGDVFDFEYGLEAKLRHVPGDGEHDPTRITHAYAVIKLKDGGILYDVMTRQEIDRIRGRSRAGSSGPWVTDYAEMAKKTVLRRALKLCPKSVELSKALAADTAADTGDSSILEYDGEIIDGVTGEIIEQRKTGTEAVKSALSDEPDVNVCEDCGQKITDAQRIAAQADTGKALCKDCAKKAGSTGD